MANRTCPTCGKPVDESATVCPDGHPVPPSEPSTSELTGRDVRLPSFSATEQQIRPKGTSNLPIADEPTLKPISTGDLLFRGSPVKNAPDVALQVTGAGGAPPAEYLILEQFRLSEDELPLSPLAVQLGPGETVHVLDGGAPNAFRWISFSTVGDVMHSVNIRRGAGGVRAPAGIALDGDGRLYIADLGAHSVWRCESDGALTNACPDESLGGPLDVAVDQAGSLYIADTAACRLLKLDAMGKRVFSFGAPDQPVEEEEEEEESEEAETTAWLSPYYLANPGAVTFDAQRNIYLADTNHQRILKLDSSGAYIGNVAEGIELLFPSSLKVTAAGDLFVADLDGSRVHKFDAAGQPVFSLTFEGGMVSGEFDVDKDGNMYLASKIRQAILKVRHAG